MKRGHPHSCALGVQFGPYTIRLVQLERKRKGLRLFHCCEKSLPDGFRFQGMFDSDSKAFFISTLQSLMSDIELKTQKATVGLDCRVILLRRIPIDPWLDGDELMEHVMWEAEQLIVDPLDQYVVDFHIQDTNENVREVLLAIVRKKMVEDYTDIVESAGLEPVCLDIDLFALYNAYYSIVGNHIKELTALVDVEPDCVRCVVTHGGRFCFGKMIELSTQTDDLLELLYDAAGQRDGGSQSPLFAKVILSGSEELPDEWISELTDTCCQSAEVVSPFRGMRIKSSVNKQQLKKAPAYMIGTGLALRGLGET